MCEGNRSFDNARIDLLGEGVSEINYKLSIKTSNTFCKITIISLPKQNKKKEDFSTEKIFFRSGSHALARELQPTL